MIIIFMSLYVLSPYNTCLLTSSVESFIGLYLCSITWDYLPLKPASFKTHKHTQKRSNLKCKSVAPFMIVTILEENRQLRTLVFSSVTGFVGVSMHWIMYWLICLEERHSKPDDQWHSSSARLAFKELPAFFPPTAQLCSSLYLKTILMLISKFVSWNIFDGQC